MDSQWTGKTHGHGRISDEVLNLYVRMVSVVAGYMRDVIEDMAVLGPSSSSEVVCGGLDARVGISHGAGEGFGIGLKVGRECFALGIWRRDKDLFYIHLKPA